LLEGKGQFCVNKFEAGCAPSSVRMHIYIVVENGDPYLVAYTTYDAAVAAVKIKHKETLDEDLKYSEEYGESCHEVDVPEAASGETHLYIEKGISIYIYRLPIL